MESYNKITAEFTPAPTNPRPLPITHDSDNDSTAAKSPNKQLKVTKVDKVVVPFNSPFYQCLLGYVSSVTQSTITNKTETNFLPQPTLHQNLVTACFSTGPAYVLEVQSIHLKNDKAMKRLLLIEYSYLPANPIPLPHVVMIKIKNDL